MGTHDCRVSTGIIKLKQGTTEDQVRQALGAFMSVHHLDYLAEAEKGNIEITETSLHFDLDILGYGGSSNESVKAFTESLAPITDDCGYIELRDFDTGDSEEACTPYFIGADAAGKQKARILYGIGELEPWVAGIIGDSALNDLKQHILALPRQEVQS